jgi:beta-lactamase regulating signal transducer with metallopeptidase domain
MLGVELGAITVFAAWLVHIGRGTHRALTETARLSAQSQPLDVAGAEVRLLESTIPAAFVSGLLRPDIYLSPSLIEILDRRELRGVLLHEQHHRRTLAPLRGLALESWQHALGWLPPARHALAARFAALEIEADAAAIARGVEPATLASALVKCGTHPSGFTTAFSAASDIRIGELVAWGRGERMDRPPSIPVEWAAPASALITLWLCHLVGV